MADEASTRDDARVAAAQQLIRRADTVERLRAWGMLASMFAAASFIAVAGVVPPGWVAIPVASALIGGYLLIRHAKARAEYRRCFRGQSEQLALPLAARNDPRRYFDDHGVAHGVPGSRDAAVRLLARIPAPVVALALLAAAVLIRFL